MPLNRKQIESYVDRLTKQTEKSIIRNYASRLRGIRNSIAKNYEKYEKNGKLTYEQMSKYNRLKALEKELAAEINGLYRDAGNGIRSTLRDIYGESFYRTGWQLETTTRARLGYSYVKPEIVNRIIQNPLTGLTLNERLSRNRANVLIKLREQLTRGLVEGESYRQMANRVKEVVEKDTYSAMRIIRTESTRCMNEGMFDSVKHATENGIVMEKTWISSRTGRTRDAHAELDGQTVGIDEYFEVDGYRALHPGDFGEPSLDIHCMCGVAYSVKAVDKPTHDELDKMKYDEWKKDRLR